MDIRILSPLSLWAFVSISLIWSVVVSAQRQGECCQIYCYALDTERPQSAHFATKTSYLIAKGPETGQQYRVPSMLLNIY